MNQEEFTNIPDPGEPVFGYPNAAEDRPRAQYQYQSKAASAPAQVDDPKQYPEAPFKYGHKDNESVSLSNGSLSYTATDFVLPGKNGMDLVIRRRYESARSNAHDADIQLKEVDAWAFRIRHQYRLKGISITFDVIDFDSARYGELYFDRDSVVAAAESQREKTANFFEVGTYYDELGGTLTYTKVTYTIQSHGKEWAYITQTRPNDHATTLYGLGDGWSFCFSSIESVPETYRQRSRNRVRYNDYLHLGDGRSYKIDFQSASGLKGYYLSDIRLEKKSGTSPVPYQYILHHKDGTKEFLQVVNASVSQRSRLAAIQDRFGNTIRFEFHDGGGVNIVDSLGRTVSLAKSGSQLRWTLPQNRVITYTVTNGNLTAVQDPMGNTTSYQYTPQTLTSQPLWEFGDYGVPVTYSALSSITHPTGAKSTYSYYTMTARTQYGTISSLVLQSRRDYPVAANTANACNVETYGYGFTYLSGEKLDYIGSASTSNEDGLTTSYTFDRYGLLLAEKTSHAGATVSSKSYEYWNKLPTKETTTVPIAKIVSRSYDDKANVLTETDAMGNTVTMTYHGEYSQPASKTWWRDAATKLEEKYILTGDGKAVAAVETWENGVRIQAVQYEYTASGALAREKMCGGAYQVLRDTVCHYQDNQDVFVRQKVVGGLPQENCTYDSYGNILTKTDPDGKPTIATYDALDRVVSEIYADGARIGKSYSMNPNYIIETDENGNSKRLDYTSLGKLQTISIPSTGAVLSRITYDRMGRVQTETACHPAPQGDTTTTYTYDHLGRVKTKTIAGYAVSQQESCVYDDSRLRETRSIAGDSIAPSVTTTVTKDKLGRTIEETTGSNRTVYTYDHVGNKRTAQTSLDMARGVYTGRWDYDYAGRVVRETDALGRSIATTYDGLGNKTAVTDYKGKPTTYTYDILGRVLTQSTPFDGSHRAETRYQYDAVGNVLKQESLCSEPGQAQAWSKITYIYDRRNRLRDTILYEENGMESRTRTVYDNVGNKTAVYTGMTGDSTDGALKTAYTYDLFGNITSVTDPMGQAETFLYDSTGQMQSKTDRNGTVTSYAWDGLGRMLSQTAREGGGAQTVTTVTYTKTGQKATEANSVLNISYQYDDMGRLVRQSESSGVRKDYGYDIGGNRTRFILYRNNQPELDMSYDYDTLNRLSTVKKGGAAVAVYTYDQGGNRSSLTYPQSGMVVTYGYNDANLVTAMHNKRGGAVISSYSYTYRLDGNQVSKQDHRGHRFTYTYDSMGRLVEEISFQPAESKTAYTYDRYGNRVKMLEWLPTDIVTTSYIYDRNNRLLKESRSGNKISETMAYAYDRSGNQTGRLMEWVTLKGTYAPKRVTIRSLGLPDGEVMLETRRYNGLGQLTGIIRDGVTIAYTYRPDGLRHTKTVDGVATTHLWDGQNIVMELSGNGGVKARYLRGINLIAQELDGQLYYYLHNAHGDVVQRTDRNGVVLRSYDYSAFGSERERDVTDANPFRYCGEYLDLETNSIYLRNRYYNPANGRFTSEDVARDGLNWYTYCGNNPIRFVDPSGLSKEAPTGNNYEDIAKKIVEHALSLAKEASAKAKESFINGDKWSGTFYSQLNGEDYTGIEVTKEFKEKVYQVSANLNMNPDDLMTLMAVESKIATRESPYGGRAGLLQFVGSTARLMGYELDDLTAMNGVEQLDVVQKFFELNLGTYTEADSRDIVDLYTLMFLPTGGGFGQGDDFTIMNATHKYYSGNSAMNMDGVGGITRGDLRAWIAYQMEIYNSNRR